MWCSKCGKELDGVILYYNHDWECSKCNTKDVIHSEKGTKLVVDTFSAGYDGERKDVERFLSTNTTYTVEQIEVGGWHTDITLMEIPDKKFNSVFFRRE